jgi:hypothetical protein
MTKETNTAESIQENVAGATPTFVADKEYVFSMRSFRMRNGFTFATVSSQGNKFEILIGSSSDYKFGELIQAKAMQANLYATYKNSVNVNGVDYPRFWDIGIG